MTYAAAIQFLYGLRLFGAKFGLENTFQLAALAGDPQSRLRFIHVAGTNGKGSTCAMLEGIYRAAGMRVGLFTSPHLVSFRERIQVNRRLVTEGDVVRLVEELQPLLQQFSAGHHPTFFEVVTVMALRYFAEQQCDLVIWETGLGGRLDATNIVTPLAGVITNIALDHQQWLGDTLEQIAAEKAGIIKPGVPVLTAAHQPEVLAVIEQAAREKKAPLTRIHSAVGWHVAVPEIPGSPAAQPAPRADLPLMGAHQQRNAALALATVEALQGIIPVDAGAIHSGLSQLDWPGRLQLVERAGRSILLDGAHNVAGSEMLRAAVQEKFPDRQPALILGILGDKDWRGMCGVLAPLAGRIFAVTVNSERTAPADRLAEICRAANPAASVVVCDSLRTALAAVENEAFTVVTGSLYLVGEALEQLGVAGAEGRDERGLNEWQAATVSA